MKDDTSIITVAQEIRRMANEGYKIKDIQSRLRMKKKELIGILDMHYKEVTKNKILNVLKVNEKSKEEIIVIDSSYLISTKFEDLEKFLCDNENLVIPGPVIEELPTNSKDEKVNFTSRRIVTILLELNIRVEISDNNIELDPTWTRNNDYYILTVCAKFKNQGFIVKLLSFDKEMILKARGIGVERYPMDFPQDNVKHCSTYLSKQCENKSTALDYSNMQDNEASKESLKSLEYRFSNNKVCEPKKNTNYKRPIILYNFTKPKVSKYINIDDSKLDILKVNGITKLLDTSSVDIFIGILKFVITSGGKIKDHRCDQTSSYYVVEDTDKVLIFTKLSDCMIEMKIGNIDKNENFIIENIKTLQEKNMNKINKKYHESIKVAFNKLLKIKLQKVI